VLFPPSVVRSKCPSQLRRSTDQFRARCTPPSGSWLHELKRGLQRQPIERNGSRGREYSGEDQSREVQQRNHDASRERQVEPA
jgi:hypothetical protein